MTVIFKKGKNDTRVTDIRADWNNTPEELGVYLTKQVDVDYWCGVEPVKKSLLSGTVLKAERMIQFWLYVGSTLHIVPR